MRGFRIATCLCLLGAALSCLSRPASGQSLGLVAAAVEAESGQRSAISGQPPAISPQPTPSVVAQLVAAETCGPGGCPPGTTCVDGTCEPGTVCGPGACDPDCQCPAAQPAATPAERSIVTHRGTIFRSDETFMARGPTRRLCRGVFRGLRAFVVEGGPIRRAMKARRGH